MPVLHSNAPGFAAAKTVSRRLAAANFRSALVGGAVRDLLLGRTPSDFDLVTTARPEELQKIFPEAKLVGASFGVVIIRINGIDMEVATARSERTYLDGRHPENISYTTDFSLDAQRRDFTVNAMMYDLETDELLDFNNGIDDLRRGILRTVGDPVCRFNEDYLRILRAIRFAAKLGFTLDGQLESALKTYAHLVKELSCERIFSELDMMLTGKAPARAIRLLESCGILDHLLPEVAVLRHITQPPQFHPEGDVLEHTLLMLSHMQLPSRRLAWSILLHDVGKAVTRTVDDTGRIRFFSHETKGAEIAETICRRLRMPVSDMESCIHAVTFHMRFASVTNMKTAKRLLKMSAGKVRVYLSPRMLHTKLMMNENTISFGSTNITKKAFGQLSELNLFVPNGDFDFAEALRRSVAADVAEAAPVMDAKALRYRPLVAFLEGLLV